MATSPNFGWLEPDNTDLVKNGALAIRTLGDAIDASLVDLKGGTTGQVLAKASGTDMDFSWVAQDDSNAIQNAIVDAKADLITATAADTPARLAVGGDYGFLQADSSTGTGLLWNNAAWTSYTPTIVPATGTFTTVTASGRYTRIGKLCAVSVIITITNKGTAAGINFSLPFTAANPGNFSWMGVGRENSLTGTMLQINVVEGATQAPFQTYNNGDPVQSGAQLRGSVVYEVA